MIERVLKIDQMRFVACSAAGLILIAEYLQVYMVMLKYWPILENLYILGIGSIVLFFLGVWLGGVMLWKHTNPRSWLDFGHRVKLPRDTPTENKLAAYEWCKDNCKWNRWRMLKDGDFLFASGKQAMYFKILWMNAQRVKLYDFK